MSTTSVSQFFQDVCNTPSFAPGVFQTLVPKPPDLHLLGFGSSFLPQTPTLHPTLRTAAQKRLETSEPRNLESHGALYCLAFQFPFCGRPHGLPRFHNPPFIPPIPSLTWTMVTVSPLISLCKSSYLSAFPFIAPKTALSPL